MSSSSSHYHPVVQPETEPDIYRCDDDTQHIFGEQPVKSIGLRELISNESLTRRQTTVCVGAAAILAACVSLALVLVVAGWIHVQQDIKERSITARSGLQMIPDFMNDEAVAQLFLTRNLNSSQRNGYAKEIDQYLDKYMEEQKSRSKFMKDCAADEKPADKWCRVSLKTFQRPGQTGCTTENRYGYNTNKPCILVAFKDRLDWNPVFKAPTNQLTFKCQTLFPYALSFEDARMVSSVTYYPVNSLNANYGGFPMNKIPSRKLNTTEGFEISDDDGETLYDLPALAFVQIEVPDLATLGAIQCKLVDTLPGAQFSNLSKFNGMQELRFDIAQESR